MDLSCTAMPIVQDHDKGGSPISFLEIDGFRYPLVDPDIVSNMSKVKVDKSDILIAAYPKSGTHWVWEITSMLLQGEAETVPYRKSELMLEFQTDSKLQSYPTFPRVLNTHVRYNQLPVEAREKGCRIIYILRNPKDVAVSFYNHHKSFPASYHEYNGSFADYLPFFIEGKTDYGSWFDSVLQWERDIEKQNSRHAVHVMYFEDVKETPEEEIKKIVDFLKVRADDELVKSIAEKCSFSNMKRNKTPYHPTHKGQRSVYRKGEVGDWKNWFTVQQSEMCDRLVQEKMGASKFNFRYSL